MSEKVPAQAPKESAGSNENENLGGITMMPPIFQLFASESGGNGAGNRSVVQKKDDPMPGGIPGDGNEVNQIGIASWSGSPALRLRSSADSKSTSNVIGSLAFNTTVMVIKSFDGGWYYVSTEDGRMGYVASIYIKTNLPEPNAKLHKVEAGLGGTAIAIAEKYYKSKANDWGQDLRFFVNVLAFVNKKSIPNETDGWRQVHFDANDLIWIPSFEFARGLQSVVNSGSISYNALDSIGLAKTIEGIAQKIDDFKEAIRLSKKYLPESIKRHAEEALYNALISLAVMMIAAIAILAVTSAIGAGLGALAGGVGAVPGAAAGFEVGMAILDWLGMAMLVAWIGQALKETGQAFGTFISTTWNANGNTKALDKGAKEFAEAIGILLGKLLEGVVMFAASKGLNEGLGLMKGTSLGKSMGESKASEWLSERVRRVKAGESKLPTPQKVLKFFRGVEIVDQTGNPLGEFDGVDMMGKKFVENKSAKGLNKIDPRTNQPTQTPQAWAKKQIFGKTKTRILNLARAAATRATTNGSESVPGLSEIQGIKKIHFEIEGSSPALKAAVAVELANLKAAFPNWAFSAEFGSSFMAPPVPLSDYEN